MAYHTKLCNSNAFADHPLTPTAWRNLRTAPNKTIQTVKKAPQTMQSRKYYLKFNNVAQSDPNPRYDDDKTTLFRILEGCVYGRCPKKATFSMKVLGRTLLLALKLMLPCVWLQRKSKGGRGREEGFLVVKSLCKKGF